MPNTRHQSLNQESDLIWSLQRMNPAEYKCSSSPGSPTLERKKTLLPPPAPPPSPPPQQAVPPTRNHNNNPRGRRLTGESRVLKKKEPGIHLLDNQRWCWFNSFPSNVDVSNHFRAVKISSDGRDNDGKYKRSVYDSMMKTAKEVESVWAKGPSPHMSRQEIVKKIEGYADEFVLNCII